MQVRRKPRPNQTAPTALVFTRAGPSANEHPNNDQWRSCFRWIDHDAWDVEIVDYLKFLSKRRKWSWGNFATRIRARFLKQEFLNEIGMSQNQLAHAIGVPQSHPCHQAERGYYRRYRFTPVCSLACWKAISAAPERL